MTTGKKLSIGTKMGAGVADLGGNVFFAVINYWLMYYLTDMIGLSAIVAGISIMIGKCWDAFTDLSMGYISDHTKSRWGRRKVYMVAGLPLLFITVVALFTKLDIPQSAALVIYYTAIYCLVNTFYTVIFIPYYSLLTEMTDDYHERTSLQSFRMLFALIGNIVGSALAQPIISVFPNQRIGFTGMAVIFAIVISIAVLITVISTKEPPVNYVQSKVSSSNFFKSYGNVFKNVPYILVTITQVLCFVSLVITQTSIAYFFKYYLRKESMATLSILAFALSCIIGIPCVLHFSKHHGKKLTWILGLAISSIGNLALYFFAPYGYLMVLVAMLLVGFGSSATYVLLMSVIADCADYDYLKTGERKDGLFMGVMTFLQKVGMALGAATVGWVLGELGYVADQTQTVAVLEGMRFLLSIAPLILNVLALIVLTFYPITEKRYSEIKQQIIEREERGVTI